MDWVRGLKEVHDHPAGSALLLLDAMLPEGEDGASKELRKAGYRKPILFLTARDGFEDQVEGGHLVQLLRRLLPCPKGAQTSPDGWPRAGEGFTRCACMSPGDLCSSETQGPAP
ncbi:MAG: hypothetical protein ACUVQD_02505 [Thermaceae bacterium]